MPDIRFSPARGRGPLAASLPLLRKKTAEKVKDFRFLPFNRQNTYFKRHSNGKTFYYQVLAAPDGVCHALCRLSERRLSWLRGYPGGTDAALNAPVAPAGYEIYVVELSEIVERYYHLDCYIK